MKLLTTVAGVGAMMTLCAGLIAQVFVDGADGWPLMYFGGVLLISANLWHLAEVINER